MSISWPKKTRYIIGRIETVLRCLAGEIKFIDLQEREEVLISSYLQAHNSSSQNQNFVYVEEMDKGSFDEPQPFDRCTVC